MDLSIITTYRCNSKCSMCYIWQNPTLPKEEITLKTLEKIPSGIAHLNLTGGEPTLRPDLMEIVDLLYPKAMKLEISSNGLFPKRIEPIIKKYPDIKVRFSLEGTESVNDVIRGEANGFQIKVNGLQRLKELGGQDLGFAVVIQDDNIQDLPYLYRLTQELGVELATSALHNGFQFHKNDNFPYDRHRVARGMEALIVSMLKTGSVKNWFRAYLNLGLMAKILGNDRLMPCTAATDFIFVDPWSDVYACNVRPDLFLGNLREQTWQEIYHGGSAEKIRGMVANCSQNCWMVGSARTAMRNPVLPRLPKCKPLWWVLLNKVRVTLGLPVPFRKYVDYSGAPGYPPVVKRESYLGKREIRRHLHVEPKGHYDQFGDFFNR